MLVGTASLRPVVDDVDSESSLLHRRLPVGPVFNQVPGAIAAECTILTGLLRDELYVNPNNEQWGTRFYLYLASTAAKQSSLPALAYDGLSYETGVHDQNIRYFQIRLGAAGTASPIRPALTPTSQRVPKTLYEVGRHSPNMPRDFI